MKTIRIYRTVTLCLALMLSTQMFAQFKQLKKTSTKAVSNCSSNYKSLNQYLQKLEDKVNDNSVGSNSFKLYLKTADKHLLAIKKKCPSDDVSNQENRLKTYNETYETALLNKNSETQTEVVSETVTTETNDKAYFESVYRLLSKVYSNTPNGADATVLGNHGDKTITILNELSDFTLDAFYEKVEQAKTTEDFKKSEYYIKRTKAIIEDYDSFISKSQNTYNNYLADLTVFGVKGDPVNEINELQEAKAFCEILLKISPKNTLTKQWNVEVESKIAKVSSELSFESEMHRKYLGKMVFSTNPLIIGQEQESDITTTFKSGDYIYATIYLGTNARILTDSYALNNCEVKVNNYLVAPGDETGVWFTTKMQDSKVIQFAILPNETWLINHGDPYKKNNVNTHRNIREIISNQSGVTKIKVEVELFFKGSGSTIKGNFVIN